MNSQEIFDLLTVSNRLNVPISEKKFAEILENSLKQASENDSLAMNNLGFINCYFLKNEEKRQEWYLKSASLGNIHAMYNLSYLDSPNNEVKWLLKSASLGNSHCMYLLSEYYKKTDIKKSNYWLYKYKQEDKCYVSCYLIGDRLLDKNDYIEAEEWFLKSLKFKEKYYVNNETYYIRVLLGRLYSLLGLTNSFVDEYEKFKNNASDESTPDDYEEVSEENK
jgi:hypothetical protein